MLIIKYGFGHVWPIGHLHRGTSPYPSIPDACRPRVSESLPSSADAVSQRTGDEDGAHLHRVLHICLHVGLSIKKKKSKKGTEKIYMELD